MVRMFLVLMADCEVFLRQVGSEVKCERKVGRTRLLEMEHRRRCCQDPETGSEPRLEDCTSGRSGWRLLAEIDTRIWSQGC